MAKEAILHIKEAEAKAKQIIKNAGEQANRMIRHAEEETAIAFSQLSEEHERQALEKKQKTEAAIRENNEQFSKETAELCDALRQDLLSKKAKAIDAILQLITA